MNLRPGTTPTDISNLCRPAENDFPNRQTCMLCGIGMEQDDSTRLWFNEDLLWKPTFRSDFLDAFEIQGGWVCSTQCWNDHCANEEEKPRPFLVKARTA